MARSEDKRKREECKCCARTRAQRPRRDAAGGLLARPALAAKTPLKIGCSLPLTGAGFTAVGRELTGALKVYMQQHGDTVAGRKIELIDPRRRRRGRQRAPPGAGNDRQRQGRNRRRRHHAVHAVDRPLVTEAKKATFVHELRRLDHDDQVALFGARRLHHRAQAWILAEWAIKNGSKRVVTLVNDWAPGIEAENGVQDALQPSRRRDRRIDPHSARQSGLRAVRCSASPTSSRTPPSSISPARWPPIFTKQFPEKRPRPIRHQDHRPGRPLRRRQPQQCRRSDDRR